MVRELAWEFAGYLLGAVVVFAVGSALGAHGPGLAIASLALSPFVRLGYEVGAWLFRRRRGQM